MLAIQLPDNTVKLLYDALTNPARWPEFAARLADRFASPFVQVIHYDWTANEFVMNVLHGATNADFAVYARHVMSDPRLPAFRARPDQAVTCHELVDDETLLSSDFYRSVLQPRGIRYLLGSYHPAADGKQSLTFGVMRGPEAGRYTLAEQSDFATLVGCFRYAAEICARKTASGYGADTLTSLALNLLGVPVLIVDRDHAVRFANAAAQGILSRAEGIMLSGNRLVATAPAEARKLRGVVAEAAAIAQPGDAARPVRVIEVRRPAPKPPLQLQVTALAPEAWSGDTVYYRDAALAVVALVDPDPVDSKPPVALIQSLYELTRMEALVVASLVEGASLKEAAANLGIQPSTARTHLRSAFDKTGVNRQGKLVAHVLADLQRYRRSPLFSQEATGERRPDRSAPCHRDGQPRAVGRGR